MRVLVVEDEPKMAGILERGLREEGYAVDVARTGADALWAAVIDDDLEASAQAAAGLRTLIKSL